MIPIEDPKWHDLAEFGTKTKLPPGHRIEYARTGEDEVTVRIVGPDAHVFSRTPIGEDCLEEGIDAALKWFNEVGRQL